MLISSHFTFDNGDMKVAKRHATSLSTERELN